MLAYTAKLRETLESISFEDDNFIEELLEVAQLFRPFSVAITEFISEHGFNGMFTALVSSDKIDKITINGKAITSGGKIYMPDVPIVITYHGR